MMQTHPPARPEPMPEQRPQGPSPLATLLALPRMLLDEARTMPRLFERYGDLFSVRVPGVGPVVFIGNHELAKVVVTTDGALVDANHIQRELMGDAYGLHSVFLRDGPAHHRLRRMIMPPLKGEALASYRDSMVAVIERAVARWPVGEDFALLPETHRIGLEIILRVVLGIHDQAALARWTPPFVRFLGIALSEEASLRFLARRWGGLRRWRAFHAAREACDALVYAEVRARRAALDDGAARTDVLQLLLAARDEDGHAMTDEEIRDQIMTLVLAGHETTATASAWAFERLLRHPAALARLTDEARAGGDGAYARAVVYEAIRVRPPLWCLGRLTTGPLPLGDRLVPRGTMLVPYFPRILRHPKTHEAPEEFRPERFLDQKPDPWIWMPFGGGAHRCLGDHFALMEVRLILQTVLRKVELVASDPRDEPIKRRVIAHVPGHGCRVRIVGRSAPHLARGGAAQIP